MIIKIKRNSPHLPDELIKYLKSLDCEIKKIEQKNCILYVLTGDTSSIDIQRVRAFRVVDEVIRIEDPFKLSSREFNPDDFIVDVSGVKFGGGHFAMIAGPCAVESRRQILEIAKGVKDAGAQILRGGAYKPRTSPYSFDGLHKKGLELLIEAGQKTNLPVVTEILDPRDLPYYEDVDLLQVGARNMQNYPLLTALGKQKKPVLLKRGFSATYEEFLLSAEYILSGGNPNVILCERGIRSFESEIRNTLDISCVPMIKRLSNLPIITDPSHAGGDYRLVKPLALASVAAGADGVMIEVHNNPQYALSDGPQSVKISRFKSITKDLYEIRQITQGGLDDETHD
ncbi:MAG: 3-deoxy-7-phosphoheptulonate synthase [Tissierellia bacterium]|nr:3-deoxy-7-phosphoheptulonate synthase [Tissierellia bacterium]